MANKKLIAFDGADMVDSSSMNRNWYDTDIIFRDPETKEVLYRTKNKVVLAGGDAVARKLFDVSDADANVIPTYDTELGLPEPGAEDPDADYSQISKATKADPKVLLFCVGTDGCGTEGSQIYAVKYNSRIAPDALIPFRYPMKTVDLNSQLQETYVGRKEATDYVAYYFKRFTAGPTLVRKYNDGTDSESDVYTNGGDVDCYIDITLTITKEDLREYFTATTGIDQCRFNTVSLCYAYPYQSGGKMYYRDIRPLTKLNISNEYMIDVSKGVEIIYHIYF